ncbi:hypothetical protein Tco_1048801 [Tanacetum coccineum]
MTKPLLSLDILLPPIRFPYTVKVTDTSYGTEYRFPSPNHPTSDIEDAFSSNFLDYILASSDYVPALPGKTYSSSSNNSFGVVPIVSPTLQLFHNTPIEGQAAYYAKESPIPPSTIVPPSTMLSPMFNPQEFFLPEELLSPKKQGHNQSFSSSFMSRKWLGDYTTRFDNLEAELQKAHARIAKLQRKQLGNNIKIALAHFRIANLEQIIEDIQVRHQADKEKCHPKKTTSEAPAIDSGLPIRKLVAGQLPQLVMSSPNHPTFDIDDAFSSNFPDYIPVPRTMSQLHQEKLILAL